jgi:RNA polymerase sigma-70 factor (ECF subfamily)
VIPGASLNALPACSLFMINRVKHLADEQLVVLLREDNEQAFDEIYNRYWSKLFSAAYKRLRSRETAEELVQDLFTSLWANRHKLHIHTSLAAYLFASIKYLVLHHLQKEAVRSNYMQSMQLHPVSVSNPAEEAVLLNDLQGHLQREVDHLPSKCRSVFELSRYEGQSMKEIAAKLEISEKTVENHIGKALKILKVSLKDFVTTLSLILSYFVS